MFFALVLIMAFSDSFLTHRTLTVQEQLHAWGVTEGCYRRQSIIDRQRLKTTAPQGVRWEPQSVGHQDCWETASTAGLT